MDFTPLIEKFGEPAVLALGAALIGLAFGAAAQRSGFCLRSAVIDVTGTGSGGARWHRFALWLFVFGAAIAATQTLIHAGLLDVGSVRQLTSARSLSGVLIGGALFGVGMSLTRGCVSRLSVLAANGNLRAVFSLAVFAAVATATFDGVLTPLRQAVLGLWTLGPDTGLNMLYMSGFGPLTGALAGGVIAVAALLAGIAARLSPSAWLWGLVLGVTVAAGWWFTFALSGQVFEPIPVESISFIRPAIDGVALSASGFAASGLTFGIGLLGGVLAGSFLAALLTGKLKFEWFGSAANVGRYAAGAVLMGFGGVIAGGCSVGAGLSGSALFALAPLLALAAMIAASALTELALARAAAGLGLRRTKAVPAE